MTNKEAIEFIDDRMCWGRGKWSEHHMPEIDEYWQAGLMAIEALKAQDAKDAKSMSSQLPSGGIIYRQAAIDAVEKLDIPEDMCVFEILSHVELAIATLPSAQPEKRTEERTETHACDCISRRAAIDILDAYQVMIENGEENPYAWARLRMSELPSAQPKMVCVANVTLTEEQVQEVFEKAKRSVLSVIEPEKTKQPEIICCRECKHRPTLDENGKPDFPTYRCPCRCEDFYYSWMPEDDWFCGNAERRKE